MKSADWLLYMFLVWIVLVVLSICFGGCFYGHYEKGETEVTVMTLFKDISFDPNSYDSTAHKLKATTIWGFGETK